MNEILIGTSGYDKPEWKGIFYPENLKREEYLDFYSLFFNAVELNFTFYGIQSPEKMNSFYERTNGKIKFSVKGNQNLTHKISSNWQTDAQNFKNSVKGLLEKNVLSSVLLQFPQSFHYTDENRIYLAKLISTLYGLPLIVEFRHKDWIKESVFAGLEKRNVSLAFCDFPDLKYLPQTSSIPFIGQNAYFRLHGRNENAWYSSSDEMDRYDYKYSDEELKQFVPIIKKLQNQGKQVQLYFNNHPNGYGITNAFTLKELLEKGV